MDWTDEGIVLAVKSHGETSVLLDVFTKEHGRHLGMVRGGRSRKLRPFLQAGNIVSLSWRARLDDHLGAFTVELVEPVAAGLFDYPLELAALGSLCTSLCLLAERDPHQGLYNGAKVLLSHLTERDIWPGLMVRFELEILSELGFRLDLSECAASGVREDLIYVSPKSGRAVSRESGEPYKEKLLDLPGFLCGDMSREVDHRELLNGFALSGYFFEKHLYEKQNMQGQSAIQNSRSSSGSHAANQSSALSEARELFLRRFKKYAGT